MKKLIATVLTALLATAGFAQTVDDHAKTKKGAVVGGVAGAIAGAIIGNNRGHHSSKRGAVVGGVGTTVARRPRSQSQHADSCGGTGSSGGSSMHFSKA